MLTTALCPGHTTRRSDGLHLQFAVAVRQFGVGSFRLSFFFSAFVCVYYFFLFGTLDTFPVCYSACHQYKSLLQKAARTFSRADFGERWPSWPPSGGRPAPTRNREDDTQEVNTRAALARVDICSRPRFRRENLPPRRRRRRRP